MKTITLDIETTGLNPYYGDRITCICAKDSSDGQKFSIIMEDEKMILDYFFLWINTRKEGYQLISKNGKMFDLPFMYVRAMQVLKADWSFLFQYPHFDLSDITYSKYISLDDIAKLYGLSGKNGNGKNAIKLWQDRKFAELKEYCMHDVELTEMIYKIYIKMVEDGKRK